MTQREPAPDPALQLRSRGALDQSRRIIGLVSANATGPIIMLLALPLVARFFGPEAFGLYAIFSAILAVVASLATWRYDLAIVLPEETDKAASLVALSTIVCVLMTLVTAVGVVFLGGFIHYLFEAQGLETWLLLLPPALLMAGLVATLRAWALRQHYFRLLALSKALEPAPVLGTQLLLGLLLGKNGGVLIIGAVIGQTLLVTLLAMALLVSDRKLLLQGFQFRQIHQVALQHIEVARYAIQTNFVNALSVAVLPIVMAAVFGSVYAGFLLLLDRLINRPVFLLVRAVWQVYHGVLPRLTGSEQHLYVVQMQGLACSLFAFPLLVVALLGDMALPLLGKEWAPAAGIIPWIALMTFFNAVSNSTSFFIVFNKIKSQGYFDISLAILRVGSLVIASQWMDANTTVAIYCILTSLLYLAINLYWGVYFQKTSAFLSNLFKNMAMAILLTLSLKAAITYGFALAAIVLIIALLIYSLTVWRHLSSGVPSAPKNTVHSSE